MLVLWCYLEDDGDVEGGDQDGQLVAEAVREVLKSIQPQEGDHPPGVRHKKKRRHSEAAV